MVRAFIVSLLLLAGVTACGPLPTTSGPFVDRSYNMQEFRFTAPPDLTVSENLGYYPMADVVWRGDPVGPRIEQIGAMFQTAARSADAKMNGALPVHVEVQLLRFHGVTDRTRYSYGGVYNVVFNITVRDARSGAIVEPSRRIVANLDAPGGNKAVALEQSGQTQKVRVTEFLAQILFRELSSG